MATTAHALRFVTGRWRNAAEMAASVSAAAGVSTSNPTFLKGDAPVATATR